MKTQITHDYILQAQYMIRVKAAVDIAVDNTSYR